MINSLYLELASSGRSWMDLDESQKNLVQSIYEANTEYQITARNILSLTRNLKYDRYPFDLSGSTRGKEVGRPIEKASKQLTIYPNPASTLLTIETTGNAGVLRVYNSLGLQVRELLVNNGETLTWDVGEFTPGVYLFVFFGVRRSNLFKETNS